MKNAINLTFKSNQEEEALFAWICKRSNKSGFIKDILKKEMEKEEQQKAKFKELKGTLTLHE